MARLSVRASSTSQGRPNIILYYAVLHFTSKILDNMYDIVPYHVVMGDAPVVQAATTMDCWAKSRADNGFYRALRL